ncbi:MAG: hypothetical protein KC418_12190 [Anaerolineales bacterium]|nr:hypothetical protein [Anaerolineales bacterium]MCB8952542.1 Trm112 family protein [Ardenticatenales bacterium]
MSETATLPISADLLEILRCPLAVQEKEKYGDDPGRLELVRNTWLVCADSGLKYPIRDGIPVMLIEEGEKWKDTPVEDLPVPPPAA